MLPVVKGMRQEGQTQVMAVETFQFDNDRPYVRGPCGNCNAHDFFSRLAERQRVDVTADSAYPFR
jgi:hypothetical protein